MVGGPESRVNVGQELFRWMDADGCNEIYYREMQETGGWQYHSLLFSSGR
jgi:hypothetical protein